MTSSDLYIISLTDARDNHDRLLTFLTCAARKYNESRQCSRKNRKGVNVKEFVTEQKINVKTQINSSLFVNSLLYYVFSEAGIVAMMKDKHGRSYPSNVFSKLYKTAWQREITKSREMAFKNIHDICCNILDQSDMEFASFVEHVLVLNYLNMCKEQDMPSYDPETYEYEQKVNNTVMDWAAEYVDALLFPTQAPTPAYALKLQQEDIIDALQVAALPTTTETEAQPVSAVVETPTSTPVSVAEPANEVQEEALEVHPIQVSELAEAFRAMCVTMESNWSAEIKEQLEQLLQPAKNAVVEMDAQINELVIKRNRFAQEIEAFNILMTCWDAKKSQ